MTGFQILVDAANQSLRFYDEAQQRGPAFQEMVLCLASASIMSYMKNPPQYDYGWDWFEQCFKELQRAGYAVAPDQKVKP